MNVTPIEPEWDSYVTLEILNSLPLPAKIYANAGLAQVIFLEGGQPCEFSYADKKRGISTPERNLITKSSDTTYSGNGHAI